MLQYATLQQFEDVPKCLIPLIDDPMMASNTDFLNQLSEAAEKVPSVCAYLSANASHSSTDLRDLVALWAADVSALKPRIACALRCITAAAALPAGGRCYAPRRETLLAALDGFEGEGALVLEEACRRLENAQPSAVAAALETFADALRSIAAHPAEKAAAAAGGGSDLNGLVVDAEALLSRAVSAAQHPAAQPAAACAAASLPPPEMHSAARAAVFRRRSGGGLRTSGGDDERGGVGSDAAGLLRRIARRVPPPESLPLREAAVLVRPAAAALAPLVSSCPRLAVDAALAHPARYLRAAGGDLAASESQARAAVGEPDVCRLYGLAMAEGHRFSGPEWLRSFRAALAEPGHAAAAAAAAPTGGRGRRRVAAREGGPTPAEAEARFREAAAALELLGMVGRAGGDGGGGSSMVHLAYPVPPLKTGVNRHVRDARGSEEEAAAAAAAADGKAKRAGKRPRSSAGAGGRRGRRAK